MSVYVGTVVYRGKQRLWADTPEEALIAAYACGATFDDFNTDHSAFPHYLIDNNQRLLAVFFGAVETDWLGPREWRARREGDVRMLQSIAICRADAQRAANRAAA